MSQCKKCERTLLEGETDYCPACASNKSHKIKKIIEIAMPMVLTAGGIAFKLLKKK